MVIIWPECNRTMVISSISLSIWGHLFIRSSPDFYIVGHNERPSSKQKCSVQQARSRRRAEFGWYHRFSVLIVEQEKLLEYMRDDLIKQRTIWRVCSCCFHFFYSIFILQSSGLLALLVSMGLRRNPGVSCRMSYESWRLEDMTIWLRRPILLCALSFVPLL